jgi:hypothetical protein
VVAVVPFHLKVEPVGQAVDLISTVSVPHTVPPPVKVGAPGVVALRMFIVFDEVDSPHEVEHVAV